ncbi:MAG: D-alanyl-D-alanine carboxypeptidase [Oscillospiraceae bacterium]|nr:D-alanyl-D-alanine carboxypeptidase [Oscillospiraceae bacterium]
MVALFLKKTVCALFLTLTLAVALSGHVLASSSPPENSAKAAVVYCVNTGQVLYRKNEEERLAMASTTKIMTALLTLEAAAVENKDVTITEEMTAVEGSSMGLKDGDVLPLRELAVGMLLVSGNDAANASAIAIDGSAERFAQRMNRRAEELHLDNTHFVTPSGLDDDQHYSTALDMAKLSAAAIANPDFRAICSQTTMQAAFTTPQKRVTLQNHNRLLQQYEGCIGIKTGFTKKAGRCLVSAAERDGVLLVAVTLCDPDDWKDHASLLDYGFSKVEAASLPEDGEHREVAVVGGTADTVSVTTGPSQSPLVVERGKTVQCYWKLPRFVYAPVTEGDVLGKVVYQVDGATVGEVSLIASGDVPQQEQTIPPWQQAVRWIVALFS